MRRRALLRRLRPLLQRNTPKNRRLLLPPPPLLHPRLLPEDAHPRRASIGPRRRWRQSRVRRALASSSWTRCAGVNTWFTFARCSAIWTVLVLSAFAKSVALVWISATFSGLAKRAAFKILRQLPPAPGRNEGFPDQLHGSVLVSPFDPRSNRADSKTSSSSVLSSRCTSRFALIRRTRVCGLGEQSRGR